MPDFTHLHLHTQYSLLDGAIRLDDLFPKVQRMGMKQVAVTDHGNLFGALDFYEKARAHGVKPIFGCETYVAADRRDRQDRKRFHLILLAKNEVGWRNLRYLNSMGYLEGFYYFPRIDKQLLREHSEGLIGMSACLGGEMAQTIMKRGTEAGVETAREMESIFGKGNFFLELQPNGLADQERVNGELRTIARKTGIGLVATNDCHYLEPTDFDAHKILMCVQQRITEKDSENNKLHHKNNAFFVKSTEEMNAYFSDVPEAMENAARIGDLCNVTFDLGKYKLPKFTVPDGYDADSFCVELAGKGLEKRFEELSRRGAKFDPDLYRERMRFELGVIKKMGFSGYFLIVWDFIRYAKEHGIPVGPGRGSGAGSLAAWSLRITDIDPIANKLLFERFLNPDRVSMPDFDVDFCMNRRDEVIDYVSGKYGKDNVGQIVTMHQMKARSCIKDVARAMAIPVADANRVATMVPEPIQGKSPPIKEAIEKEPRLQELYDGGGEYKRLLDIAMTLEGLNRHAGKHAAGIVIGEKPLWEYVPCFRPADDEDGIVTQFNMNDVEKVGLIKFDFLGLKTLTVIQVACDHVNRERAARGEAPLDLDDVAIDDADVYKMLAAGDCTGVFQVESSGFRELLKKLKPDCFEDIVAAGALFRPGPLEGGMVDDFIERKHGRKRVEYDHPKLQPILKDTYGVIVYQEQVMQIASALAGYSLGQADLLRRAMGKKKKEVMEKEKAGFLAGAKKNGVDPKVAEKVFDLMEKFAGYGFNRSHSAAYGLLTYRTGYLKRAFPVEFFAALLTCDKDTTESVVKFIAEARARGIPVQRPDVNESDADFTVVKDETSKFGKAIRFGLAAVKGVGEGAVEVIRLARTSGGPFLSLFDFCNRVDARKVNRKVLEALVKSGAFDGVAEANGVTRARVFGAIEMAMERAAAAQRERESGQTSLLGLLGGGGGAGGKGAGAAHGGEPYPDAVGWMPKEILAYEKESLGFYISGHPLDRYAADLKRYTSATTESAMEGGPGSEVIIGGVVFELSERTSKSGSKYAFFKLEDQYGQVEMQVFARKLDEFRELLKSAEALGEPVLVTGRVDMPFGEGEARRDRLVFQEAKRLSDVRSERTSCLELRLNADDLDDTRLVSLQKLLREHPGTCKTVLRLSIAKRSETLIDLGPDYRVAASDDLIGRLEQLCGDRVAVLR